MLRPQFETMESLTLLSASPLSALSSVTAQIAAQPQAKTKFVKVTLKGGSIAGDFVRTATANTVTYTIQSGNISKVTPLQTAAISGTIAYNVRGAMPTSLKKATITMTVDPKDAITVTLTATKGSSLNSLIFKYKITKATGEFKGNKETRHVTFQLDPNAQQGPFSASFLS